MTIKISLPNYHRAINSYNKKLRISLLQITQDIIRNNKNCFPEDIEDYDKEIEEYYRLKIKNDISLLVPTFLNTVISRPINDIEQEFIDKLHLLDNEVKKEMVEKIQSQNNIKATTYSRAYEKYLSVAKKDFQALPEKIKKLYGKEEDYALLLLIYDRKATRNGEPESKTRDKNKDKSSKKMPNPKLFMHTLSKSKQESLYRNLDSFNKIKYIYDYSIIDKLSNIAIELLKALVETDSDVNIQSLTNEITEYIHHKMRAQQNLIFVFFFIKLFGNEMELSMVDKSIKRIIDEIKYLELTALLDTSARLVAEDSEDDEYSQAREHALKIAENKIIHSPLNFKLYQNKHEHASLHLANDIFTKKNPKALQNIKQGVENVSNFIGSYIPEQVKELAPSADTMKNVGLLGAGVLGGSTLLNILPSLISGMISGGLNGLPFNFSYGNQERENKY